jgi:hypothetical protein
LVPVCCSDSSQSLVAVAALCARRLRPTGCVWCGEGLGNKEIGAAFVSPRTVQTRLMHV